MNIELCWTIQAWFLLCSLQSIRSLDYITEILGGIWKRPGFKNTFENKARLRNRIAVMAEPISRHPSDHMKPGFIDMSGAKASEHKVDHVYAHTVTV